MLSYGPLWPPLLTPVIEDEKQQENYWQKYSYVHQQEQHIKHALGDWQGVVLFLLIEECLILIKRSELLKNYRGQMALIGGKREKHEHSMLEVALREFSEETEVSAQSLKIHGLLPFVYSARAHLIAPLVAECCLSLNEFAAVVMSNGEWEHILAIPLKELGNEHKWQFGQRMNSQGQYQSLLFRPISEQEIIWQQGPMKEHDPHFSFMLWGATARIVWNYFQLLNVHFKKGFE